MNVLPTFGAHQRRQELVVAFIIILLSVAFLLVFAQEKLIYYIAGILALAALIWCQLNSKRWVYLVFLSIPFSPSIPLYEARYTITAELSDFVVLITLVIFLLNYLMGEAKRKQYDRYVMVPIVVYISICMISSLLGYYTHYNTRFIYNAVGHLLKWSGYVFLYIVIFKTFNTKEDIISLLRVIIIAFGLGSIITVYNYSAHAAGADVYRAGGLFEGLNSYAVLLASIFVFYFNLILQKKGKEIFPLWIMIFLFAIIAIAILLTFSRTAWIGVLGSLTAIFFLRGRRHIAIMLIFFTILVVWGFRTPVEKRLEYTFEPERRSDILPMDLGGRDWLWEKALKLSMNSFFFGVGYMNFQVVKMGTTPHNQYLEILGDSGIFALAAFIFFLVRLFKANIFLWRNHPLPFFQECAFGALVVLCMVMVVSMAGEFLAGVMPIIMAFYACARISFQVITENNQPAKAYPVAVPVGYKYQWNR